MKESELQKLVTDFFDSKNWFYLRCNSGSIFLDNRRVQLCPPGTPDLFLLVKGKAIFIELKRNKKVYDTWKKKYKNYLKTNVISPYSTRSVIQHKRIKQITESGGTCISTYSFDDLMEDFKKLKLI